MSVLLSRLCAVCLLLAVSPIAGRAVQTPVATADPQKPPAAAAPVDPALVDRALSATTDAEREALFVAHPELATDAVRMAVGNAATRLVASGDPARGLNGIRTVLHAATRAEYPRGRVVALNLLGTLSGQLGDFATAESALGESRAIAEPLGDLDLFITASNNLGIVQRLQGRYDEALDSYQRTLAAAETAGRRDSMVRSFNNMGIVATMQGDMRRALEHFTRALGFKEQLGETAEIANASFSLGMLHHYQRNFALASDYYERARIAAEKFGNQRMLVSVLNNIGNLHALERRFDRAKPVLEQALKAAEANGDRVRAAFIWHNLGSVAREERRFADSDAAFRRSLELRETIGDPPGIAETLIGLAQLYESQQQWEEALRFAERGVEVARSIGLPHSLWGALSIAGTLNVRLGDTDAAVRALQESIDAVERLRQQVAGGIQDVQRFFEDKAEPYYQLAAVHAATGKPADAFAAAERARARVLLDLIASGKPIVRTLSQQERTREQELDRTLASLGAQREAVERRAKPDQARLRAIDAHIADARRAKAEWQFALYATHPDLRFGRGEAPIIGFDQVHAVLPDDTAIVMFMTGVERTWLALLTRTAASKTPTLEMFPIGLSRVELSRRAERFNRQVSTRDLAFAPAARALYTSLLGRVDDRLARVRRLVIVPDGVLWNVPFQALITPRGRFVIEERAVSYAPSVSALYRLHERRSRRASRAASLVAIGDPAGKDDSVRLPEAARELRSLGSLYGANSRVFIGADATEARLRTAALDATVLHIATHGELVRGSPMYSFVTLSGSGESGDYARDGRVEAWEIANMALEADLAVLSACETALGAYGGGEGVIGLSWSLFAAGASTAAVSLWRVDSASTTALMLAFHQSLRRAPGTGPSDAMRSAALQMIRSADHRHPFYWAGFVVMGAP